MKGQDIFGSNNAWIIACIISWFSFLGIKKNVKPIYLILGVMVLSIVLAALGILK